MVDPMRAVVVGALLVGACSKGPASAAGTGSASDAPVAAEARPIEADRPAADQKGSAMGAEAIATEHYTKKGWKVEKLIPFPRVPHLFRAEFSDGIDYVLVHQGKVVEAKGLEALSAYVRDTRLLQQPGLEARDLTTLLLVFAAYPPVSGPGMQGNGFYDGPEHPTLVPAITGGALVLHYIHRPPQGAVPQPGILQVSRWTLAAAGDGTLSWRSETIEHKPGSN
jgi:hypothetical protein